MKIWIPIALIFTGLAFLIIMGIVEGAMPELQVHQLLASGTKHVGCDIKLQGIVEKIHSDTRPLEFTVRDRERVDVRVRVVVDDVRPDIFKEGNDVAVIGRFNPDTLLVSGTKLFTKCPSKYEASEEALQKDTYQPPPPTTESGDRKS